MKFYKIGLFYFFPSFSFSSIFFSSCVFFIVFYFLLLILPLKTFVYASRNYVSFFPSTCTFHTWQMNVAPRGSKYEKKNNEVASDPEKYYNWEKYVPYVRTITKESEENIWYHFIKGKWTYLNHKTQQNKPAGVIEGGQENYDGKGLKLLHGKDRQREKQFNYTEDHGVEWRQNQKVDVINFDLHPDGCQDVYFGESDEMMEDRQWCCWSSNYGTATLQPSTGWKNMHPGHDLTELAYPWTHKPHLVNKIPIAIRMPPPGPKLPRLAWHLAARGKFGEWIKETKNSRIDDYREMKDMMREFDEEEEKEEEALKKGITTFKRNSRLWRYFNSENKKLSASSRNHNELYFRKVKDLVKMQFMENENNLDYVLSVVDRKEMHDYLGGGESNCCEEELKQKTIALNLSIYPIKKKPNTYEELLTVDEMCEMYHYTMSEVKKLGIDEDTSHITVDEDTPYDLKHLRKNFKVLESFYRPSTAYKKFGEEFGDCLRKAERIPRKYLRNFDLDLPLKTLNHTDDEENVNFLSEYSMFYSK